MFGFLRRTSLENGEAVKDPKKKTRHSSQKFSSLKNALSGKDKTENRKSRESLQNLDNKPNPQINHKQDSKLGTTFNTIFSLLTFI